MSDADLHRDIESTREALGDTVEALVHEADVKARVEARIEERKDHLRRSLGDLRARATGGADRLRTSPGRYVVLAVLAALLLAGLVRRRHR